MDPLSKFPVKYQGRLPRLKKGADPCANSMMMMMYCYMDNDFNPSRCTNYIRQYEECMASNVGSLQHSKTWQYRRLLKKIRMGI